MAPSTALSGKNASWFFAKFRSASSNALNLACSESSSLSFDEAPALGLALLEGFDVLNGGVVMEGREDELGGGRDDGDIEELESWSPVCISDFCRTSRILSHVLVRDVLLADRMSSHRVLEPSPELI